MPLLGGGVAGLYLFGKDGERLDRIAGYGLPEAATQKESFRRGEGLVGQCAVVKSTITLTELPPDYLRISSGVGSAAPARTTAWPLIAQDKLLGVLEVGSFADLSPSQKALLEEALPVVGMSLEVLERNLATHELLGKTQEQARELEEQTEELTKSQEELLAQKEELLTQQEELMAQREQIQASEERTRLILDFTAEGIFGTDTNGRITFINPAACQVLGFAADELLGQPSHAAFHHHRPDGTVYPREECPMFAAFTEGRASRVDNEYLWRKDGTGVPVEYGATPVLKDGVIVGSVVSFTDITERKETEERINAYFNASSDGLLLLSPERGFIDANPRAASMFGVGSVADLLKLGPVELSPERQPDGSLSAEAALDRIATALQMSTPFCFDWLHRRLDGTHFQCEITLTRITLGGKPVLITCVHDVSERKQAEQRLRDTERFFRSVLELAPDALLVVDTKGIIQLVNAEAESVFGYTRDELVGHPVEILVPEDIRAGHLALRASFHRNPVKRELGSWASIARSSQGRLYVSCRDWIEPSPDPGFGRAAGRCLGP